MLIYITAISIFLYFEVIIRHTQGFPTLDKSIRDDVRVVEPVWTGAISIDMSA